MNDEITAPFKLVQELTFDEDDGMWELRTRLISDNGFDECSNLMPCFLEEFIHPTFKDCKELITELLNYFIETQDIPK